MTRKEAFSDEPIDMQVFEGDFGNTPLDYLTEITSPKEVKIKEKSKKKANKTEVPEEELDYFTKDGKVSVQFLMKESSAFLETASIFIGKMVRKLKKEVNKNDDEVGKKRAN